MWFDKIFDRHPSSNALFIESALETQFRNYNHIASNNQEQGRRGLSSAIPPKCASVKILFLQIHPIRVPVKSGFVLICFQKAEMNLSMEENVF